jgi:streptogramin lyase
MAVGGDIWVINNFAGTATLSTIVTTTVGSVSNPPLRAVIVDQSTGNVWVSASKQSAPTNAWLIKFSPGLTSPVVYTLGSSSSYITNPVIDTSGNVFVANNLGIFKITPGQAAGTVSPWNSTGSALVLGISSTNDLIIPGGFTNQPIKKVAADGTVNATWVASFSLTPSLVTGTPDGNIYIANTTTSAIAKITSAGVVTANWVFALSGNAGFRALSMTYDAGSNLFVGNGVITKITPAAVQSAYGNIGAITSIFQIASRQG